MNPTPKIFSLVHFSQQCSTKPPKGHLGMLFPFFFFYIYFLSYLFVLFSFK